MPFGLEPKQKHAWAEAAEPQPARQEPVRQNYRKYLSQEDIFRFGTRPDLSIKERKETKHAGRRQAGGPKPGAGQEPGRRAGDGGIRGGAARNRPARVGDGVGSSSRDVRGGSATASGARPRAGVPGPGGAWSSGFRLPGGAPGPPLPPPSPSARPPPAPRAPAASPRGGRGRGPSGGRGRGRPPRRYRGIPPGMKTLGGPQSRLPPALLPEPRRGFFGPGKKRTAPGPGERSFERRSAWLISRSPSVGGRRGDAVRIEPAREEEGV